MYPDVPAFEDDVVERGVGGADNDGGSPSKAHCEGVNGMSVISSF